MKGTPLIAVFVVAVCITAVLCHAQAPDGPPPPDTEPAEPSVLIIKALWGRRVDGVYTLCRHTDGNDIERLLTKANAKLGVSYTWRLAKLDDFHFDPAYTPIVYFTNHGTIVLTEQERAALRQFVLKGGTIWGDACCGSEEFTQYFRNEMRRIFPNRPLRLLPLDHPLYVSCYQGTKAQYRLGERPYTDIPKLEAIHIGCRAAVIFTPIDLSCGWEDTEHIGGVRYRMRDATRLGINMIAYALAYHETGLKLYERVELANAEPRSDSDFWIGRIKHNGDWYTDPNALQHLMLAAAKTTEVEVSFREKPVDLVRTDLCDFPFLYMSGHDAVTFSDEEVDALRTYLVGGGFLLADACCGRLTFDKSFRELVMALFPGRKLERLALDHELFKIHHRIGTVQYTPRVQAERPGFDSPHLEGVTIDGRLVLVYSPYDLGNGWEDLPHPHTRGLESPDAFRLGVNVIIYTMTH